MPLSIVDIMNFTNYFSVLSQKLQEDKALFAKEYAEKLSGLN